ncbi:EmrB/QacA subfamily drug resistance transporter [Staphylococcus warneri]|uniref:DHA2 family efflux MFS transporter permease subunit n=1 Tax=Staphylococcus TaxID=1279 RepID=UPI000F53AEF4|nr:MULTISPECIES: DHA2 family efflux MFS transporter permease subunit [Staphylococcus]QSF52548.1 DHA2 family efflux MFS transporter permease subunit [Staphylococcus sp. SB1-57]RQM99882.1 MFS transporter [Staphylococcus warneri]
MSKKATQHQIPKDTMNAAWAIAIGAIAPMLDSTMINIGIQQLNQTFHTNIDIVQWGITGYILALAIAIPFSGWLMNHFNSKYTFIIAMLVFGITSLFVGISPTVSIFILFRIFQGFSAGVITSLMFTLLVKTAGQDHIGRVMAIVSTPMIFGPILGPTLGGFIIHFASWRWMFFINIVVSLISVPLMMKYVPSFKPFEKHKKLDIWGILLLCITSATVIYGISLAGTIGSFIDSKVMTFIFIGVAAIVAYIFYNKLCDFNTVLPLNLFKNKTYSASMTGLLLANVGIMGPMVILPLYFQEFKGYSAIGAALALIPQGIGMLITRPYIGTSIDRIGSKKVIYISIVIAILGTIPLIFVDNESSIAWLSFILFIRGCSVGGINLGLMADAYKGVSQNQLSEAGVGINMIENIGASFGTAIIATVVASNLSMRHSHHEMSHSIVGFHEGFLVSMIAIILILIPTYYLGENKTGMDEN